jgi:hypothetical protein
MNYAQRKGINLSADQTGNAQLIDNNVVVPICDLATNQRVGSQSISPNGNKRYSKDFKKTSSTGLIIGDDTQRMIVAEGWATACAVNKFTKDQVVWALDAGHLPKTCEWLRERHPCRTIIVAADNDDCGRTAAIKSGLPYTCPTVRNDWDDELREAGLTATRELFESSLTMGRAADGSGEDKPIIPQALPDPATPISQTVPDLCKTLAFRSGISAAALMAIEFPPVKYIISGYVAEGVTLFAGAPKIGKSWMVLGIAVAIASGWDVFGSIPCEQGDVLYLALEDNHRRLKSRLHKMGVNAAPERLTFCTDWPKLDEGGAEEIAEWVSSVVRPSLVIVDVVAKIRPTVNGRDAQYDVDYRTLAGLQELAGEHGVAILAVHHTRKMEADDPFDAVSGTRGLTGAADSVLVLKREMTTGRTILYGRGRDIEEIETVFSFDRVMGTWSIVGAAAEFAKTDERQAIRDILSVAGEPQNAREISDLLGRSYEAVRRTLSRMAQVGEVEKMGRGLYACPKCPNVPNSDDDHVD